MSMEKYDSGEIRKEPVYYLRLLNKHKYLMAVCVIIAAILTFLHSKAAAPVYTASTKIVIKKSNIDPLTGMPIDIWDHKFVETQVQIIKSVAVGKRVVESLDLVNTYKDYVPEDANKGVLQNIKHNWISLYHNLSGHPADAPMEKNASPKTGRAAASPGARAVKTNALDDGDYASAEAEFAEMISGGIDIEAITDSRVFIISYTSVNLVLARSITNSVMDSYGNQVLDMQATSIKKSLR